MHKEPIKSNFLPENPLKVENRSIFTTTKGDDRQK